MYLVVPDQLPARQRHGLRRERIRRLLGLSLDDAAIVDILTRLGMELTPTAAGWEVLAPSSPGLCGSGTASNPGTPGSGGRYGA